MTASASPPIAAPGIEFTAQPSGRDHTQDCSLTYAQWKEVDASTRHGLSLDARAALGYTAQRIFARFMAITKLTLRYAQGSGTDSLSNDGARHVVVALPSEWLARLKLRGLRQLSDDGFASLAGATPVIRKLSVASISFGPKAFVGVLRSCPLLDDLSVKRLHGLL
uniref:Uncharacterized protein n=1 Tax=Oryza barthii TaxID=65489 RepID=A0A0D3FM21_9ORYZ